MLPPPEAFSLHREIDTPHVLVVSLADDDEYFIVNTTEEVTRACLELLDENSFDNMYPTRESAIAHYESTLRHIATFESPTEALPSPSPRYHASLVRDYQVQEPEKTPSEVLADSARRHAQEKLDKDLWFADQIAAVLAAPVEEALKMTTTLDDGSEVNLVKHLVEIRQEWPLEGVRLMTARSIRL